MTVRIPISADAGSVTTALDRIREAIRRAGQEGRDFAKLDLSHPELKDFGADLRRIQDQVGRLTRDARGATAATARSVARDTGYDGRNGSPFAPGGMFDPMRWQQQRPDDWQRHYTNAGRYVLQGTRFAPPPPTRRPAPAPGDDGNGDDGNGDDGHGGRGSGIGRRIGSSTWGAARSFGVAMMAASGVRGIVGMVTHSVGLAQRDTIGTDTLMRRMGGLAASFDLLRESVHKTSDGLGITYQDAQRLSTSWTRLTNETSPEALSRGVRNMVGFARAGGGDVDEVTRQGAIASRYGLDTQRFATIVGDIMVRANMRGQQEDAGGAVTRFMDRMVASGNDPGQATAFATAYAGLAAANPNSRFGAGETILARADSTFQGGGGRGMASRAFLEGVLRRRGIGDPYQQQYYIEGGMFGAMPGGGTFGAAALADFDRVNPSASRFQRISGISGIFGGRMREAEQVVDALRGGALPGEGIKDAGDTEGRRVQQGLANLENALTRLGNELLPAVGLLTTGVTSLTDVMTGLAGIFNGFVGGGAGGVISMGSRLWSLANGRGDPGPPTSAGGGGGGGVGGGDSGEGNYTGEALTAEQGAQRARHIYDQGIARGLTHTQAMAVVAQAHGESGFRSRSRGDSGNSRGVFQHDPARRAAMERQFGLPAGGYYAASFEDQVRMSYWEMLESRGSDNVGTRLRATRTAAEANDVLVNGWERPTDRAGAVAARTSVTERFSAYHMRNPNFGLPAPTGAAPAPQPAPAGAPAGASPGAPPTISEAEAALIGLTGVAPANARRPAVPIIERPSSAPGATPAPMPGSTPAPEGARPGGASGESATRIVADPLRVTVQNEDGTVREEMSVPLRPVPGSPQPYGSGRYSTGGGF